MCTCNLLTPTIPPSPQLTSPAPVVTQPAPFPTPGPAATAATPSDDSIYNENIPHTRAERIVISEIFLLREALQLLVQRGWDGNPDEPLPLSAADFDPAHLQAYIADESRDDQALTLPAELESIYISPDAAAEIAALLLQARDEYMDYAASQGTLPLYLDEVNQRTLPPDPARLLYHPINDPNAPPTEVGPLTVGERDDFSQLVLNVYPVDIYNAAESLRKARILGEEPASAAERLAYNRRLRDIGLRFLVYHEMTHVLQRAYITVHTPEEYRTDKAAWIYASQTLVDVDTQYHWKWGGHFADVNNRHISNESQAEGIAFVVLVAHYNMSPQQQAAAWDHLFGRLEDSRAALDEARDLFDRYFPDYPPDNFGSQLGPIMESYTNPAGRYTLMQICSRLSNLPAAVGYLHPMLPQDTVKFWAALREP
ncbi:MAG TPA: hypothetical protein PLJ78_04865 [Anaerolineae bacterium]|nr:hypothetical protein [Anaerolineae bacterium]